jgi:hypothetical protein
MDMDLKSWNLFNADSSGPRDDVREFMVAMAKQIEMMKMEGVPAEQIVFFMEGFIRGYQVRMGIHDKQRSIEEDRLRIEYEHQRAMMMAKYRDRPPEMIGPPPPPVAVQKIGAPVGTAAGETYLSKYDLAKSKKAVK